MGVKTDSTKWGSLNGFILIDMMISILVIATGLYIGYSMLIQLFEFSNHQERTFNAMITGFNTIQEAMPISDSQNGVIQLCERTVLDKELIYVCKKEN